MKFYKAVVRYPELYATYRESLGTLCLDTNNKYWNQEDIKVLITKITCDCMTVLCAVKNLQIKDSKVDEKIRCYLKDLKSQSNISKLESARLGDIKEITLNTFAELLNEFSIEKTIEDKEVIRESLGYTSDCILYKEKLLDIVECDKTDKHGYFFDKEEKKRIKGGLKINGPVIAPVHYVIYEKNKEIRDSICKELVSYLWKKGRICNRRIVHVDDEDKLTLLLNSKVHNLNTLDGGVAIVKVGPDIDKAKNVLDIMSEDKNSSYSNKFTIIILADTEDQKGFEKELKRCFSTLAFYPIVNQRLSRSKAMEFFEELLEEDKITVDKSGWQEMFTENEYTYFEAGIIYRKWLRGIYHIHNNFPQYRGIVDNYFGSHEEKGVDGRKKLDDLIGLTPVKSLVEEIIDYYKIQKMRQKMNVQEESSSMHMVFWGNPGTAKTTVARIMAQILKEEGILKKGELIEVGRSDLVGKYVGWTAKSIKEYFDKAKGSVLFIDEAYSLNDEQGSFGDEAINTIVQEMENMKDEVVVIMAGYKREMMKFIEKNSGMRSRIKFFVDFMDYTEDEMYSILNYLADNDKITIAEGVKDLFTATIKKPEYAGGNGRSVRNIYEKAKMKQAKRIMGLEKNQMKSEIGVLRQEDFYGL